MMPAVLCRLGNYFDLQLIKPFQSVIEQALKSSKLMPFSRHIYSTVLCVLLLLTGAEGYKIYWCVEPLSALISCIAPVKSVLQKHITAQQWTIYRDGRVLMWIASFMFLFFYLFFCLSVKTNVKRQLNTFVKYHLEWRIGTESEKLLLVQWVLWGIIDNKTIYNSTLLILINFLRSWKVINHWQLLLWT